MTQFAVQSIKTKLYSKEQNLLDFLLAHSRGVQLEGAVLAITSKIVSISEGQIVAKHNISKSELVKKEADRYLGPGGHGVDLTIKHGLLIPSAGIDESNSVGDDFILYPKSPFASAEKIWRSLKTEFNLKNLAVILTDSRSGVLRRGVTGISLAHWGFEPVKSNVGEKDLYGQPLKFTHINMADALASMAVLAMGEAAESSPMAVISGVPVKFSDHRCSETDICISPENDLYAPLFKF